MGKKGGSLAGKDGEDVLSDLFRKLRVIGPAQGASVDKPSKMLGELTKCAFGVFTPHKGFQKSLRIGPFGGGRGFVYDAGLSHGVRAS